MEIYNELKECLSGESEFMGEDGQVKKWVVLERARDFDSKLISLLLGNEKLKSEFFKDVAQAKIFMQEKFCEFLELKSFMPDSFTSFKNKIGLTFRDKFISKSHEVVLNFPYKDCVLEGGASSEEDKSRELFFNEILARDEITQLFEPKVLTNFTRYGNYERERERERETKPILK